MVVASAPINELAQDIRMPSMLGGLSRDPREQGAKSGVTAVIRPPRHMAGCI